MEIDFAQGTWEILACRGCQTITFRESWTNSEDMDFDTGEYRPDTKLYPPRADFSVRTGHHFDMPEKLRRFYRQTLDCASSGYNIFCAIGIRMMIEAICSDRSIHDGPNPAKPGSTSRSNRLDGKIEGLVEAQYITPAQARVLHELRFIGNDAAHELLEIQSGDLRTALEVLENAIVNIYDQDGRTQALRRRRSP